MDKMWNNQNFDKMKMQDSENMAVQCGLNLRKLIHIYRGGIHKIDNFFLKCTLMVEAKIKR